MENHPSFSSPSVPNGSTTPEAKSWCLTPSVYDLTDTYRTQDGKALFTFGFVQQANWVEIDIISMPDYGERSTDAMHTHRLLSSRNQHGIDVGDPTIIINSTVARELAAKWAEHTWSYIQTGTSF